MISRLITSTLALLWDLTGIACVLPLLVWVAVSEGARKASRS